MQRINNNNNDTNEMNLINCRLNGLICGYLNEIQNYSQIIPNVIVDYIAKWSLDNALFAMSLSEIFCKYKFETKINACITWIINNLLQDNLTLTLKDLYPNLIKEFKRLTNDCERHPTLKEIEIFFDYNINDKLLVIKIDNCDKFFLWFSSMCNIIKDLSPIYNHSDNPLISLFYDKTTSEQTLKHTDSGTFILRLTPQQNELVISYKHDKYNKIQHVLLIRSGNEMYKIDKSDKEMNLFQLIRPWSKLQYLYTQNKPIAKRFIF
eukprot:129135_1